MRQRRTNRTTRIVCIADVDTRLYCSTYCALCVYYMRDRRDDERRMTHRPTSDRRVFGRL